MLLRTTTAVICSHEKFGLLVTLFQTRFFSLTETAPAPRPLPGRTRAATSPPLSRISCLFNVKRTDVSSAASRSELCLKRTSEATSRCRRLFPSRSASCRKRVEFLASDPFVPLCLASGVALRKMFCDQAGTPRHDLRKDANRVTLPSHDRVFP